MKKGVGDMVDPKPRRVIDPAYLDFIRQHPCCCCLRGPSYPHHLKTVGSGGSDHAAIPLCYDDHAEIHRVGLAEFEERHGINLWKVAAELLSDWIQREA